MFEVASHITHVRDSRRRRTLGEKLRDDITSSINRDSPWTITTVRRDILFRSQDVIRLAERFLESSGPNYSFADISIIDLAAQLRQPGRTVKILAFDGQLCRIPIECPEPARDVELPPLRSRAFSAAMRDSRHRQYPGGGANPQYPSSINPAMCRHVRSSYWRPMIWMPTGRPFASPMGATVDGR